MCTLNNSMNRLKRVHEQLYQLNTKQSERVTKCYPVVAKISVSFKKKDISSLRSPSQHTLTNIDTHPFLKSQTEYSEAFSFFQMPVAPGEKRSELLHTNQLQVVMRSLGLQPPSIDDWKAYRSEHTFKHVDNKGEGRITFEDFLFLIDKKSQTKFTRSQLVAAFEVFDEDKTGTIKTKDLRHMMISLGSELTAGEIDEMFLEADIDGTGEIKYRDFIDVIMAE